MQIEFLSEPVILLRNLILDGRACRDSVDKQNLHFLVALRWSRQSFLLDIPLMLYICRNIKVAWKFSKRNYNLNVTNSSHSRHLKHRSKDANVTSCRERKSFLNRQLREFPSLPCILIIFYKVSRTCEKKFLESRRAVKIWNVRFSFFSRLSLSDLMKFNERYTK